MSSKTGTKGGTTPIDVMTGEERRKLREAAIKATPSEKFTGSKEEGSLTFNQWKEDVADAIGTIGLREEYELGLLNADQQEIIFYMMKRALGGDAKSVVKDVPVGDLDGVFDVLQSEFAPVRVRNVLTALRKLIGGPKCGGKDELAEFLKNKKTAYERIKDVKVTVEDLHCLGVIDGLPSDLSAMGDIAITTPKLKYADLKRMLDDKVDDEAEGDDKGKALVTAGKNCMFCGAAGHLAVDCFKMKKLFKGGGGNKTGGGPKGNKGQGKGKKCYICDSEKHLANACPNAKKGKKARAKLAKVLLAGDQEE